MANDRSTWGKGEWQAYALALETDYQNALDGWGATVREMEAQTESIVKQSVLVQTLLRDIRAMHELLSMSSSLTNELTIAAQEKRGRGRPKKNGDDTWMIAEFDRWKTDFQVENRYEKPTDTAVMNWAFEQMFARHGLAVSKVKSRAFQRKLKTFKNRLGDVRNPVRKLPVI